MNTNRILLIAGIIFVISLVAGTSILLNLLGRVDVPPVKIELVQPKDTIQIYASKDTTTYHWSDNFTDVQLREMVRSGHLKLR